MSANSSADPAIADASLLDKKKQRMLERLQQRDSERKAIGKFENLDHSETTKAATLAEFSAKFDAILSKLSAFLDLSEEESAKRELQNLQNLVAEYASNLPSWDLRKAQSAIKDVESRLLVKSKPSGDRSSFNFVKPKSSNVTGPGVVAASSSEDVKLPPPTYALGGGIVISGKVDEKIVVDQDCTDRDVVLTDLKSCRVVIVGCPASLRLRHNESCTIVSLPVKTSVFVDGCCDCRIVVACQQIRIHSTKNAVFYLHIVSNPIIEDSSEVMVAPYNLNSDKLEDAWRIVPFGSKANQWKNVQDFNWLAIEKPSPNWKLLDEKEWKCWTLDLE